MKKSHPGVPSRLRLTRDNVQLLQPAPEALGWVFGTVSRNRLVTAA
jgi:hypothetical protein